MLCNSVLSRCTHTADSTLFRHTVESCREQIWVKARGRGKLIDTCDGKGFDLKALP